VLSVEALPYIFFYRYEDNNYSIENKILKILINLKHLKYSGDKA